MTQTHKRVKLLTEFIESAGLVLDCFVDKKDGRVTAKALAHDGQTRTFSLSNSSSQDPRGDLNERARIRRWAVEVGQPTQLAEKIREKLPEIKRVLALEPKTVEEAAIMDAMDKLPRLPDPEGAESDPRLGPVEELYSAPPLPTPPALAAPAPVFARRPMTLFKHKDRTMTPPAVKPTPAPKPLPKKLTLHEQYTVIEWLKAFDTAQFDQASTLTTHINEVQKLVPVPVSVKFVSDAVKMLGKKYKDRRAAYTEGGPYRRDRCRLVAIELRRMADSLGFALSEDFLQYANQDRGAPNEE